MSIIKDVSDPALTSLTEIHWFRQFEMWGSTPYGEVYEAPEYKRVNLFSERTQFNSIFLANLKEGDVEGVIDEAKSYFGGQGLNWSWYVGPMTKPDNMGDFLARALTHNVYPHLQGIIRNIGHAIDYVSWYN